MPVTLRPVEDADVPHLFEQQRDPVYDRMAAFTHGDVNDRAAFEARMARIRANPAVVIRAILVGDEVVGSVASFVVEGEREVTYGVARERWGQGIATAALRLLLAEVDERPLHARAAADNAGSLRVLAKCGFVEVARERGFAGARGEEIEEVVLRLDA